MRVLLISHTCQSRSEGQPRAEFIGALPGVQLKLLVPDRWRHYGLWRGAEMPLRPTFEFAPEKVRLPWAGPAQWYLHYYPRLRRTIQEFQPDIIDLWEEPWGMVSAHTCWLRDRWAPLAKIVSETEQNLFKSLPFPFEKFRKYVFSKADLVIGRTEEAVDVVRRKGYAGVTAVVPNSVDTGLFRKLDRDRCRSSLGLSGFVVGFVGRFTEEKGIFELLEAVKMSPPDVNLVLTGRGPADGELRQRAATAGLEGRVRVLPERALEQMPEVFNALDVLAVPSHTTPRWKEQFGRVIIEAHACGVPVIGSTCGAIPSVVGEGGIVVPEKDPHALAAALAKIHNDRSNAEAMGQAGYLRTHERYTWQATAEAMHTLYVQILKNRPPRSRVVTASSKVEGIATAGG
jgi:glycosyltransferase involved in cell wall biosynthesis